MNNDRELLELAAKAAGIEVAAVSYKLGCHLRNLPQEYWNPLADDGDALRLAVKLRLSMDLFDDAILVGFTPNCNDCEQVSEDTFTDPYAATRRAIVRAAAEIGRSMR